jgi:hypothetical protein
MAALVLDASTLVSLLATGEAESILKSWGADKVVCDSVAMAGLVEAGLVFVEGLRSPEEESLFVRFAASVDDGEAKCLAICASRRHALATEDRKARRLAGSLAPPVPLVASSELLFEWQRKQRVGLARLRQALLSIEVRANFHPWRDYPLRDWWLGITSAPA